MAVMTVDEAKTRIPNMSLAELRAEAQSAYQRASEIVQKYPDAVVTDSAEQAETKTLWELTDLFEARLGTLESASEWKQRVEGRLASLKRPAEDHRHPESDTRVRAKSAGQLFTESVEYKAAQPHWENPNWRTELIVPLVKDGREGVSFKDLLISGNASSGGAMIFPDIQPGVLGVLTRTLSVLDLISRSGTTSNLIEYVQEDGTAWETSAAMTAEATATTGTSGTKPESALAFSLKTAAVRTLAHWLPVTNQMLADAPQIRGLIDNRLLLGLQMVLETQIISGAGTGQNFTGILNAGIQTQAAGTDAAQDAIFKAAIKVMVTGLSRPNAVVLHPNDFQDIRLAREATAGTGTLTGGYLMGPPSQTGPTTLWGLPVTLSLGITENTGLVGDFAMGATLFDREQPQVRVGLINDQFVRNMQTILAELRAAFVVWRPNSFCKVTGI